MRVYEWLSILAATFLSLLPCTAFADDRSFAKFYGEGDVYGDYAPSVEGRALSLHSGGMTPSYIGFSSALALGAGIQLTGQLESVVNIVDVKWQNGGIGDRRATVGVNTTWGSLQVGRQFTPHALFIGGEIDAFTWGFSGSSYAVLAAGADNMLRTRAVMVESPRIHGFSSQLMLAWDARTVDGEPKGSNDIHARLDYRYGGGPDARPGDPTLLVGCVFVDQRQLAGTEHRRVMSAGATYAQGPAGVTAVVQRVVRLGEGPDFLELVAGARLRFREKHQLLATWTWSHTDDDVVVAGAQVYGLAYVFYITPKITAYASAARLNNFGSSQFSLGHPVAEGGLTHDLMIGGHIRF